MIQATTNTADATHAAKNSHRAIRRGFKVRNRRPHTHPEQKVQLYLLCWETGDQTGSNGLKGEGGHRQLLLKEPAFSSGIAGDQRHPDNGFEDRA